MSVTFKLVLKKENSQEPEIRRLTLSEQDTTLQSLRAHASKLFRLRDDCVWYFKWTDEEGDLVTITEEYEFQEFVEAKADDAIVRLSLFVEAEPPVRVFVPPRPWGCHRGAEFAPKRYGALCDKTDAPLSVEEGNWYHQLGTSFDLCVEEFSKLPEDEQRNLVKICQPSDLGEDMDRYQLGRCFFPFPQEHHKRKEGKRGCGKGENCKPEHCKPRHEHKQDKQEKRDQKREQKQEHKHGHHHHHGHGQKSRVPFFANHMFPSPSSLIHVGWCDVTEAPLIVGKGWYHKKGSNYDLCETEYNKLSAAEQDQFVRVEKPEDLGADREIYNNLHKFGGAVEQFFQSMCANFTPRDEQAATVSDSNTTTSTASVSEPTTTTTTTEQPIPPPPPAPKPERSCQVVAGPSIAHGSQVRVGSRVVPVWEVTNTATEGEAWTDVRVRPKQDSGNAFQLPSAGYQVPSLLPGQQGLVTLDFVVPESAQGQGEIVEVLFEFVDEEGSVFGEPLKLALAVEPKEQQPASCPLPAVKNEAELLVLLRDMGFPDLTVNTRVLREHKGDINASVIALLHETEQC